MKLKIGFILLTACLVSPSVLARNQAGVVVGSVIMGIGGVTALISGIIAGVASDEAYCDSNSRFSQKAVISQYDCSYQTCAVAVYNGGYYTCNYVGNQYQGYQSCEYSTGGYSQCIVWQRVAKTCDHYGCQDPNTRQAVEFLHRKRQPEYQNSLYAVYAGASLFGTGLITMIASLLVPNPEAPNYPNPA